MYHITYSSINNRQNIAYEYNQYIYVNITEMSLNTDSTQLNLTAMGLQQLFTPTVSNLTHAHTQQKLLSAKIVFIYKVPVAANWTFSNR
jgi:hypothetical protein